MTRRPFLLHLLFMLLGYALAVLAAVTVVVVIAGAPTIFPDQGAWGSFYSYMREAPGIFMFGLITTSIFALPGWLISVVLAEWKAKRGKLFFGVTGFLTALLALFIFNFAYWPFSDLPFYIACLIGGFFGGLAYWAVSGRHSGVWRNTPEPFISTVPAGEGALK